MKTKQTFANRVALLSAAAFGLIAITPLAVHASGATLGDAVNATYLTWQTADSNSTALWFPETSVSHDGDAAAQSGAIPNGSACALYTTVPGPCNLTFWWKVSSESGHDFLKFYLDTLNTSGTNFIIQGSSTYSISGEQDWEQKTFAVPAGTHKVFWVYSKNGTGTAGSDSAWVDEVVVDTLVGLPQIGISPLNQTVPVGSNVTFVVNDVSTVTPVSYQWMLNNSKLTDETNQTLVRPSVGRKDRGTYGVTATNINGSVTVSNATLRVNVIETLTGITSLPGGALQITFQDGDNVALTLGDLPRFTAQATTNLLINTNLNPVAWVNLPNALSISSGSIIVTDTNAYKYPTRYYRLMEKY